MRIEARGNPPFRVSSGPEALFTDAEQFSKAQIFSEAFKILFDLSNGGLNPRGEYIIDSQGEIVFSVNCQADLHLLREVDEVAFIDVEFVE